MKKMLEANTVLEVANEVITPVYPIVFVGTFVAIIACTVALYYLRNKEYVLKWLLFGFLLNKVGLLIETGMWYSVRMQFWPIEWLDIDNFIGIPIAKILYCYGSWFAALGAIAALRGWTDHTVHRLTTYGSGLFLFAYIAIWGFEQWLLS